MWRVWECGGCGVGCRGYGNVEGVVWDVEGMGMWRV